MVAVVSRKTKLTPAEEAQAQASALVEEQYQNFDVVWAKLGSFPWWPGVLFYSWDAVIDAGLELKQVQNQLVIPPPTTQVLLDGKQRTTYSVLIMYLDKFDCSVVEVSPKTVCPFAINYHRLKERPKGKTGAGFNVALERALRLLHMNYHMTLEELDAIAPIRIQPTDEELAESQSHQQLSVRSGGGKRQKRAHTSHAPAKHVVHVEDLEDEDDEEDEKDDVDFGTDYSDDEDHTESSANRGKTNRKKQSRAVALPKAVSKKASAKGSQRVLDLSAGGKKASVARGKHTAKRKSAHHAEAIGDDDGDDSDFEIVNTSSHKAPAKPASSRKKTSRKEGRIHHDVINVDEDDDDEERNTSDDDFQISIAHPSSKTVRSVPTKIKLPKHSITKADEESVVVIPAKLKKKNKTKTILLDAEVEVVPVAKPMKKRGPKPKRQSHHDHDASHEQSVQIPSRSAEPSPLQQLTLTPLSTIWTTRETSTTPADDKVNAENFARLAYKLDLLWDEAIFSDEIPRSVSDAELPDAGDTAGGAAVNNERGVGKRQVRSVQQSQIRQSMLTGNLDPHTMVQCESYLPKGGGAIIDSGNSRSRGAAPQIEAPFDVVVHPDVAFVCDLHSHLATCEIIGFLGGRWVDATKTLYIQAAFPCRSLEIEGDDGSTDVEMDPGSEIELREIIQNAELEVVGWYHSHPAFAPDPSIRDIENQTSYQQLFQRTKHLDGGKTVVSYPFVGLIVGTYDQRRESPVGLFRYFHTREERLNSGMRGTVHMPYELVPRKRHYRSVLEDEKQDQLRRLPLYVSVAETLFGADKTVFVKSPRLPNDEAELQARNKPVKNANVAVDRRKKRRKSSSDLALLGSDESVPQPVKKKRGRPKGWKKALAVAAQAVQAEAAPEVVDLVTDASQELSQSQEPVIPTNQTAGISTKETSMADPDGRSYSGGARSKLQDSIKGMDVKMPAGESQHSSSTQVPPTDSSVRTDDVVMVDESSSSQLDHREVQQDHGSDDIAVAEPDGCAQGVMTGTLCSDEVICDSSQSQDTTRVCCAETDGSRAGRSLKNGASPTALVTNHEDVVPASASSSSSRSESSLSYDASQSQVSSHPDDVIADETAKTTEVEDDPFAGIEILPNEPSVSSVPPADAFLKHADPAKAVNAAQVGILAPERPAPADVAESISSRNTQLLDETKDQYIKQNDEVVGDSGPDVNSQPILGRDETKIDAADGAVQHAPVDDQFAVGESTASGGSTPIDGFSSAGRRRTRKPSLTVRRQSGVGASPVWTNNSPRSPGVTAKREGDRDGEKMGEGSKVNSYEEGATATMNDTVLVAPERKLAVDSGWDDVEIISVDYMDSSRPVKIETTPLESVEAVVKVTEAEASEILKSEKDSTCVDRVEEKEQAVGAANRDLKEMQPTDDVQVNHDLKVEGSIPTALPVPRHSSDFVPVSPIPSDAVAVTADSQKLRPTSVAGGRGRRSKCIDVVDDAGFLEEPLDRYKATLLRSAAHRLGLLKKIPSTDRNKEGYIAAIRAHWDELLHQPSPDVKSVAGGATDSLPPPTSTRDTVDDTVDENDEVAILDEAKDVIRALVSNVESLVANDVPSSAATNQPNLGTIQTQENAPATTETSIMNSDETLTTLAPKPEIRDPAQASVPGIEASPTQVVAPAASSTSLSELTPTKAKTPTRQDRCAMHLQALRTKYTRGVYGCTEQVITLIDYYRDFHRRTDLYDVWKGKILKVDKITASLRADVEHVNLPVALRDAFIKDVIGYLCASWKLSRPMK